jgi:hypothetical protein
MFLPLLAILVGEAKVLAMVAMIFCVVLVVVILLKLLHLGVFILLHPHALGMLGVFALIAFLFAGFVKLQAPPPAAAVVVGNGPNGIVAVAGQNKAVVQNAPWAAKADADVKPAEMSEELAGNPTPKKTSEAASANHATDAKGPPEWTNQPPHRQGDSYVVVLRLDPETSGTERDEWLDQRMIVAAKDYIDERLYQGQDVSKIAKFDTQYLYSNCVKEIYPSSGLSDVGKEAFVRMEFDRKFRAEVDRRYRASLEVDRLRSFSGIAVAGLTVLSGLYLYLRTTVKKGVIDKKKPAVAAATS